MAQRFLVVALVLVLVFSLFGCAGPGARSVETGSSYPAKEITYVVPFNPGGQSDIEARRQQPLLEKLLGTSVVITYKPGGGGATGWGELVRAKPDGYYICGINIPHIIVQPLERGDAGYRTEDILPVALFQNTPIGLAVVKSSGIETIEELVAYAREHPGALTVGGSGTYTGHHLAYLQFKKLAGVELTYVPFTGAAPQIAAFLGGHVSAVMANSNDLVQHQDKMNILAIGSAERFAALPEVPTFGELGFDMTSGIDRGVAVPPGTPKEIVAKLEKAFLAIATDPDIQRQMKEQGFVPLAMGSQESLEYITKKKAEYAGLVEELKGGQR